MPTACRVGLLIDVGFCCFGLILIGGLVRVGGGWGIWTEKFVHRLEVVIDEHVIQVAVGEWIVRVCICLPLFLSA